MSVYIDLNKSSDMLLLCDWDTEDFPGCCGIVAITAFNTTIVKRACTKWGHHERISTKGKKAASIISLIKEKRNEIKLVILDKMMNEVVEDGVQKFVVSDAVGGAAGDNIITLYELMTTDDRFLLGEPVRNAQYSDGHKIIMAEFDIDDETYDRICKAKKLSDTIAV